MPSNIENAVENPLNGEELTVERFFGSDIPQDSTVLINGLIELSKTTGGKGVAVFQLRTDLPEWNTASKPREIHVDGSRITDETEQGQDAVHNNSAAKLVQQMFQYGKDCYYRCTDIAFLPNEDLGMKFYKYAVSLDLDVTTGISGVAFRR